jgi:hypothetical protein
MGYGLEARAWLQPWSHSVAFYLLAKDEGGSPLVAEPVCWQPRESQERFLEPVPSFRLDAEAAQRLMDELWSCGFRPAQGKQSEGVTVAQERHLQDMRAIAFDRLKIDTP